MNLPPPPPQDDDPIITQFKPEYGQWELNDDNVNHLGLESGQTILHNYCEYINSTPIEVFRYLIETKGCDMNVQDEDKNTPLHHAFSWFSLDDGGELSTLMYLLTRKGIDININGEDGLTLLHSACLQIHDIPLDVFKYLIETLGADINAVDDDKNTPLQAALRQFDPNDNNNNENLVYLLRQKGVNANIKDENGCTLLHSVCEHINSLPLDVFKLLIETHGADINAIEATRSSTPLHIAFEHFYPDEGGDINTLMYLLNQNDTNINIKNCYGDTVFHLACEQINELPLDLFQRLIQIGADVNALCNDDDTETTLLHYAIIHVNPECDSAILTYLFSQDGVNFDMKNDDGCTFLHLSCRGEDLRANLDSISDDERLDLELADTLWSQVTETIIEKKLEQVFDDLQKGQNSQNNA
jgi:ankyrin repeat protein